MNIKKTLLNSYVVSLVITIILALLDSDPMISYSSFLIDIFFMSILIWLVILPITYSAIKIKLRFSTYFKLKNS